MADLRKTYLWVKNPDRRLTEIPFKVAGYTYLTCWALLWYVTGGMMPGFWCLNTLIAIAVLYTSGRWIRRSLKDAEEYGELMPWWRKLWNILFAPSRFAADQDKWELLCRTKSRLEWNGRYPKLQHLKMLPDGSVRAFVNPGILGGDMNSITALTVDVIPGVMRCKEVSLTETKDGNSGAGWITFWKKSPLDREILVTDLPLGRLDCVSFGVTSDGGVAEIRKGKSVLVSGVTDSGKGSVVWDMVFDIRRDNEPTEVYVVDPKRMEFSVFKDYVGKRIGNLIIKEYVTTAAQAAGLFERFAEEMHSRQETIGSDRGRKLETATEEFPSRVVICDELADIAPCFNSKAGGASSPFGIIIGQGRSTQDYIIAQAQMSKISVLGDCRDAFPIRISMRQGSPEGTFVALGIRENEGVPCSSIPFGMPGVGFFVTDTGVKARFRSAYATDKHIAHLMKTGELPEDMITRDRAAEFRAGKRVHFGYRAMSNVVGQLYSGETNKRERRYREHAREDVWEGLCPFPDCGTIDCRWWAKHVDYTMSCEFDSHDLAVAWERAEIHALQPMFNIAGAGNNRRAWLTRRTYRGPKMTRDEPAPVTAKDPIASVTPIRKRRIISQKQLDADNLHLTHISGMGGSE